MALFKKKLKSNKKVAQEATEAAQKVSKEAGQAVAEATQKITNKAKERWDKVANCAAIGLGFVELWDFIKNSTNIAQRTDYLE